MVKINIQDPQENNIEFITIGEENDELTIATVDTANYYTVDVCELKLGKLITQAIKNYIKKEL